jgi:hypothetical protein
MFLKPCSCRCSSYTDYAFHFRHQTSQSTLYIPNIRLYHSESFHLESSKEMNPLDEGVENGNLLLIEMMIFDFRSIAT